MRRSLRAGLQLIGLFVSVFGLEQSAFADAKTGPAANLISPKDAEFFESKVRPILVANCQSCHGPSKTKGGLRLDDRQSLLKGGETGPALVPGHPDKSRLIEAIRYQGDTQMPPKGKLKPADVATLTDWVQRGAPWPSTESAAATSKPGESLADRIRKGREFWAFRPVTDPPAPPVKAAAWPKTSVDRFILARLESKGLAPSREADKRSLIRRATFDVTGLPPTPQEVDAFLNDSSANAFDKVVERLLSSPHYGERWGRHWLDIARYGEDQAHSFQPRLYPQGFRYRDWVANALNRDLPYNRFLIEQIAGDLLDEPGKQERLPALGFFALGPVYYGDAKKHDQVDDRIDTLTRGVLGLTVACARCHDHKYDPIPTTDYYALAGVFHSSDYQEAPLAPKSVVEAYDRSQVAIEAKTKEIDGFLKKNAEKVARSRVDETSKYVLAAWKLINRRAEKGDLKASEVAKVEGLDAPLLDRWVKYLSDDSMMQSRPALAAWKSLMKERKPSPKQVDDPTALAAAKKAAEAVQASLRDIMGRKGGLALADEPKDKTKPKGTASDASSGSALKPLTDADKKFYEDLLGEGGVFVVPKGRMESVLTEDGRKQLKAMRSDLDKAKSSAPAKYPVTHTLADASTSQNMKVLIRGNDATQGETVPRRFLTILGGDKASFQKGSGRLELAKAIVDPANPLTARVFVNRVWQHYFGKGLVATPSNFGSLGERPSHPELLDHLASQFMREGWSIKALHRSILLSATYRQSSDDNSKATELDPANTLLWRASRKRLEVEPWRDAMLAVSGRLDEKVGGPSVSIDSADNTRRTFYAKVSRHDLSPLLRLFDFPDPNITSAERTKTTVALQQLLVLNDEFLVRSAKGLVERLSRAEKDDAARVKLAYTLLFAREPSERERSIALAYLAGKDQVEPKATNDLSRWERYAQVLLASNEFLFID